MIEWFFLSAIFLELFTLSALIILGSRGIKKKNIEAPFTSTAKWPLVAMIVPATGANKSMRRSLNSLLSQDYPQYEIIFVARNMEDQATSVIRRLIHNKPYARLILSGPAETCGQKNHNLLAGIKEMRTDTEVIVFCDSTRLASRGWLKALVEPVVKNEAIVSTGYHHVISEDSTISATGCAIIVLSLYLTKGIGWLNQPWGGGTAITKKAFNTLRVKDLWFQNVVDDVSLAALLKKTGTRVQLAPEACLLTHPDHNNLKEWIQWLTRQILYLKFCFPGIWLMAGIICHLLPVLVIFAGGWSLALLFTWNSPAVAFFSVFYLIFLSGLVAVLRTFHPKPGSLSRWLAASYAAIFVLSWCHLKTLFAKHIHWKGITYRVAWGGNVEKIEES